MEQRGNLHLLYNFYIIFGIYIEYERTNKNR